MNGRIVIKPTYKYAGFFEGEFAEIKTNEGKGIINRSGNTVILPKYNSCEHFYGGYFKVKKGDKYGIVNSKNRTVSTNDVLALRQAPF